MNIVMFIYTVLKFMYCSRQPLLPQLKDVHGTDMFALRLVWHAVRKEEAELINQYPAQVWI